MKTDQLYKGWTINHDPEAPAAGVWRAARAGVGMNTNTLEGILRMVDTKDAERRAVARPPMPDFHRMGRDLLAAYYVEYVGFDPFEDDPENATVEDVADSCEFHYQAARCTLDRAGHFNTDPDFDPACGVFAYGELRAD